MPNRTQQCRIVLTALLLLATGSLTGCAQYQFGNRSLYRPDVRTVYVPVFKSNSFRTDLGERITEAVIKEIESVTIYKVTDEASADTVLRGTLLVDNKIVQGINPLDEPRILQESFQIQYEWLDQRGQLIRQPATLDLAPVLRSQVITANGILYPEPGQSMITAEQEAINTFAREVVRSMESPW